MFFAYRFTLYPTKQQVLEISQLIIKNYPFLKDKSVGTGYDSWFAQLYEKFRNERKSIVNDPEVILHKRKKTKGSEAQPVALKLRRGGINWEPPFPEGEDEHSMKRHKEWLQNRRKLMNQNIELTEVRAQYPALFNFEQIIAEFERILGVDSSILVHFQHNFHQVCDQILAMGKAKESKKKCGMEAFLTLLDDEFNEEEDTANNHDEIAEVAMALLPFLLKSSAKDGLTQLQAFVHFLPEKSKTPKQVALEREQPFPFIIVEGTLDAPEELHLAADKQLICSFRGNLVTATLGLLASYYVFMYNYPVALNSMFLYFQKCILQIHDGRKLPSSVITFVNDIDRLSNSAGP
ncbi:hypothetical protein OS493_004182 [Desmophyllum pertusum]|uniref:Sterile alpha motif domain-containing 3-like n=1 Tax=Desmophyllum pertusum TaxID=174260 RepID=A0A9W9ZT25_9CNID|nr:hypothetical protein OS493_004182 [Desmophyllum pertusum]